MVVVDLHSPALLVNVCKQQQQPIVFGCCFSSQGNFSFPSIIQFRQSRHLFSTPTIEYCNLIQLIRKINYRKSKAASPLIGDVMFSF
jgi:hypothetical protein